MVLAKEDGFACCRVEGEIQMLGRVILLFFLLVHISLPCCCPGSGGEQGLRPRSPWGSTLGGCLCDGVAHPIPNPMDPSRSLDGARGWSLISFALQHHLSLWFSVAWKAPERSRYPASTVPAETASPFLSVAVCTAVPFTLHVRN